MDLFNGRIAIDYHHTHRLARRDLAVFVEDAAIKRLSLALEAALIGDSRPRIAATGAFQRCTKIRKQQNGEVRLKSPTHRLVKRQNNLAAKFAATTLVGFGRIGKAVAKNDTCLLECRSNDLGNRLRTVGKHQPEFGARIKRLGLRIQQQRANPVPSLRPARLSNDLRLFTASFEPRGKPSELSRFARSVEPLEGEEESLRHGGSVHSPRI